MSEKDENPPMRALNRFDVPEYVNRPSRWEGHFKRLKDIPSKPRVYVIRKLGIEIGEITRTNGPPGFGKTTLQAMIGAMVSNPQCKHPDGNDGTYISADIHGKVLWIAIEDDHERTLSPRARAANADPENFQIWTRPRRRMPTSQSAKSDVSELLKAVRNETGVALVMFDHIALAFADYPDTKAGRTQAINDWTNLARERGFAVLVNGHFGKSPAKTMNPLDQTSGGSLIGEAIRKTMFIVELPPSPEHPERREFALFDAKANNSGQLIGMRFTHESTSINVDGQLHETSRIKWLGCLDHSFVQELLNENRKPIARKVDITEVARLKLREFFADGPRPVSEYAVAVESWSIPTRVLKVACDELGITSWKLKGAGQSSGWMRGFADTPAPTDPPANADALGGHDEPLDPRTDADSPGGHAAPLDPQTGADAPANADSPGG